MCPLVVLVGSCRILLWTQAQARARLRLSMKWRDSPFHGQARPRGRHGLAGCPRNYARILDKMMARKIVDVRSPLLTQKDIFETIYFAAWEYILSDPVETDSQEEVGSRVTRLV